MVLFLAWSFWVAKGGTIWFENMVKLLLPEIGVGVETSLFSASFMPGLVGVAWSGDWAGILLLPRVLLARLAGCGTFSYCYFKMMWWECQGSNLLVELSGWTWDFSFYLSLKLNECLYEWFKPKIGVITIWHRTAQLARYLQVWL